MSRTVRLAADNGLVALPDGRLYDTVPRSTVHRVWIDATGGTWTITVGDQTTDPLDHDATPAEVTTALEALSTVADDTVTVRGGLSAGAAQPYYLTWDPTLGDVDDPALADSLTGGAGTATIEKTQAGQTGQVDIELTEEEFLDIDDDLLGTMGGGDLFEDVTA